MYCNKDKGLPSVWKKFLRHLFTALRFIDRNYMRENKDTIRKWLTRHLSSNQKYLKKQNKTDCFTSVLRGLLTQLKANTESWLEHSKKDFDPFIPLNTVLPRLNVQQILSLCPRYVMALRHQVAMYTQALSHGCVTDNIRAALRPEQPGLNENLLCTYVAAKTNFDTYYTGLITQLESAHYGLNEYWRNFLIETDGDFIVEQHKHFKLSLETWRDINIAELSKNPTLQHLHKPEPEPESESEPVPMTVEQTLELQIEQADKEHCDIVALANESGLWADWDDEEKARMNYNSLVTTYNSLQDESEGDESEGDEGSENEDSGGWTLVTRS